METKLRSLEKRRVKRKRKREMKFLKNCSEMTFQSLGVMKISREINIPKVQLTKQCLNPVVEDFHQQHVSKTQNCELGLQKCKQQEKNLFNETIDLCDTENSVDNISSNVLVVPSLEVRSGSETVIDLSVDVPEQMEVIDLTETVNTPLTDCSSTNNSLQPTVIDISEDESNEKTIVKSESEISIIGMFSRNSCFNKKYDPASVSLPNSWRNSTKLVDWGDKLKKKYMKRHLMLNRKKVHPNLRSKTGSISAKVKRVGENIYVNSPITFPSNGLRPIIIDGSNVAFMHSSSNFCCKRLEICINYFKEKGHKVTAFVPQYRINPNRSDNPYLLRKLERQGDVVLTPSKNVDGRNIVPYDDRFIVQTAVLKGGIIVTRDNYNDLLKENPAWAETIKYRTLAFTWVDDVLMFPKDPLGEHGPSLEEFLRFH